MRDVATLIDRAADRLTDRLMRRFPGPRLSVETRVPLVSFTFDDVPDTALTDGAAILERYGVRGTFYIAGGLAGRQEPDRTLITAEGCRALQARGHEIGCHTFSHDKVRTLRNAEISADLDKSKAYLDPIDGGVPSRNFAYPYNAASFPARKIFARRFDTCRAGGDRINRGAVNPVFLSGMEIRQPESRSRALTAQIDAVVENPGWLIFFTHDIAGTPTPYGCTPETFDALVRHAVESGCVVVPVRDALKRLGEPAR